MVEKSPGASPAGLGVPAREDALLIARCARGDRAAFAEIVAAHQATVARLVRRLLGWGDESDDVVQDVFLRAWTALRRFRGECSLATWLTRIAVNACRNYRRRRLLRLRWLRSAPDLAIDRDPGREGLDRESFHRVRQAVQRLPARCREVIVLRYLEDMPIEDVCRVLGLARNVVDTRLHRGRQRLKAALADLIED